MAQPNVPDFFPVPADDPKPKPKQAEAPDFIPYPTEASQQPVTPTPEYGSDDWYAQKMGVKSLGELVPQALTGPMTWIQKNINDPLDKIGAAGAEMGRNLGAGLASTYETMKRGPVLPSPYGPAPVLISDEEMMAEEHPRILGAAEGLGETLGGMADPRMAPLMLAGPEAAPALRALMSAGFSAQMISSAMDSVPGIKEAIAKGDSRTAAQLITKASVSGAMGAAGGLGAINEANEALNSHSGNTKTAVAADTKAVEGTVLPKQRMLTPGRRVSLGLPPATIEGEPIRTFIPPTEGPGGVEGRPQLQLGPVGPNGAPIPLPGVPEPQATPYEVPDRPARAHVAKAGAAAANPTVPSSIFAPAIDSPSPLSAAEKESLIEEEKRNSQLPSYLRRWAGGELPSEPETQQPKSDLSEVKRDNLPGEVVDPHSVNFDFESHPFMLRDDVDSAHERLQKGEQMTAIVHTDPETGEKRVVDGHGSTQAALEANAPLKISEAPNVEGDEDIGLRAASHYLAADKPEVDASFGDGEEASRTDDVPTLEAKDREVRSEQPQTVEDLRAQHEQLMKTQREEGNARLKQMRDSFMAEMQRQYGPKDLATQISEAHAKDGGSTFNPAQGNMAGKNAYSVATDESRTQTLDHPPTPDEVKQFMDQNKDALSDPNKSVGTWNAGDGRHVLDIVDTVADRNQAMDLARQHKQEAIYHLGGDGEIKTEAPASVAAPQAAVAAAPNPQAPVPDFIPARSPFAAPASVISNDAPGAAKADDFTHWRVDTRTGREYPSDATYKPRAKEILVRRDATGKEETIAEGKNAFEKLPRQGGLFGSQRGSATPDFLSFIASGGMSEVGRRVMEKIRTTSDVDNWPEVARFLSPEDRATASKAMQRKIVAAFNKLGDPNMIEEAARAGSISRGWYRRTGEMIHFMFGKDADMVTKFIATTSPMKSVEQNFVDAFNLYADWNKAGRPQGLEKGREIRKLLAGRDLGMAGQRTREGLYNILVNGADSTGPKVSNFAKNLRGETQAVTKDRWMSYLFGNSEKYLKSKANRMAMDAAVRAVGAKMNMLPSEVQESGWSFIRNVINFSEKEGISPNEAAQQISESQIKAGSSEFAKIISSDPKVRASLDRLADTTGNERFRVSTIERSRKYQQLLAEHGRARGVSGGLAASDRSVLGSVAERAQRARSEGYNASAAATEDDTSFFPAGDDAGDAGPKRTSVVTDKLAAKYGTTQNSLEAGFMLPDGRMVPLRGEHGRMIDSAIADGVERTDSEKVDLREGAIRDENVVRSRVRNTRAGKEVVFTVPDKVTEEQIANMKKAVQSVGVNGNMVIENLNKQSVRSEFATPADVDASLRKIGAHPTEEAIKGGGWSQFMNHFHQAAAGEEGSFNVSSIPELRKLPHDLWAKLTSPIRNSDLIGEKYAKLRAVHDKMAELMRLRDNVVPASHTIANAHVKDIVRGLPRDKERLAVLMSDADSRNNLQQNHPSEYQQAINDPNVMGMVSRYQSYEKPLTAERASLGYSTLSGDYLRRVYDEHSNGDNSQPYESSAQFRDLNKKSRFADPEYHYQNGRHEFGPAYGSKYVSQKIIALDQAIVNEAARTGAVIDKGAKRPASITYNGKKYYSPDEAKITGSKDVYAAFDPERTVKFKAGDKLILAPRQVVDAMSGAGQGVKYQQGPIKALYQKGAIALGVGIPHAFANLPRRIMSSVEGGSLNPKGWAATYKVMFDKTLRDRSMNANDPVLKNLIRAGAVKLDDEYSGIGSKFLGLQKGHELIFKPGSWGGMGGIDVRARMEYSERLMRENPNMSWGKIADQVENTYGKYNQANWTKQQKSKADLLAFPGWVYSSIRTSLDHPLRSTVPAAVTIYAINQALNKGGLNRDEDKDDVFRIHVGDHSLSPTLFNEPLARAITLPLANAVQSKLKGGSNREAVTEFARGAVNAPGRATSVILPYVMTPFELAANRQFVGNEREIYKPGAFDRKTKFGVSEGTAAVAKHLALKLIPQVGRVYPEFEDRMDIPGFLSSQVGLSTFHQDDEDRLKRDMGITGHAAMLTSNMSKMHPEDVSKLLDDEPVTRIALGYHPAFTKIAEGLRQLDADQKYLSPEDYQKAREYYLKAAASLHEEFVKRTEEAKASQKK